MNWRMAASIAALAGAAAWHAASADEVVVFRCSADDGSVGLQDQPCADHQQQQRRTLPRPRDATVPPPFDASTRDAEAPDTPAPVVPVAAPIDPSPLYDCVRHDGTRYESRDGIPQRQWVPLWVLGLDPRAQPDLRDIGRPRAPPTTFRPGVGRAVADPALAYAAGTWVEDVCTRLSSQAACARRASELDQLRRRQYGAQQGDRERLRRDAQVLMQQLRRECGAS